MGREMNITVPLIRIHCQNKDGDYEMSRKNQGNALPGASH